MQEVVPRVAYPFLSPQTLLSAMSLFVRWSFVQVREPIVHQATVTGVAAGGRGLSGGSKELYLFIQIGASF